MLRPAIQKLVPSSLTSWTRATTKGSKRPWSPSPDTTPLHTGKGPQREFHRLEDHTYGAEDKTHATVAEVIEDEEPGTEAGPRGMRPASKADGIVRTREWKVYSTVEDPLVKDGVFLSTVEGSPV